MKLEPPTEWSGLLRTTVPVLRGSDVLIASFNSISWDKVMRIDILAINIVEARDALDMHEIQAVKGGRSL